MILFAIMILIAWILIIGLNILLNFNNFEVWYIIMATITSTLVVIFVDGITAGLVRILPSKWFNPFSKRYQIHDWEKSFYNKLSIKKWKDKVPELGSFTHFSKSKIQQPRDNQYIKRYLLEACYGRVGHALSMISGFLIIFMFPLKYSINFGIPVAIVNAIMNAMPWFVLRYNTPKLIALYKRNEKTAQNNAKIS